MTDIAQTFDNFDTLVAEHFATWWRNQRTISTARGEVRPPPLATENGPWKPDPSQAYVALYVVSGGPPELTGTSDDPVSMYRGILQVDLYLPAGTGTRLFSQLGDRVKECWRDVRDLIPGFKVYATSQPLVLPAPEGWAAKHCDTPYLWIDDGGPLAMSYRTSRVYAQVAHGRSVLDAVRQQSNGAWVLATDPSTPFGLATGVVTEVLSPDQLRVNSNGLAFVGAHGLTVGTRYFNVAGRPAVMPGSGSTQALLVPTSADEVNITLGTEVIWVPE